MLVAAFLFPALGVPENVRLEPSVVDAQSIFLFFAFLL